MIWLSSKKPGITSSSIKCTIPFNEYVVSHMESKNVGMNVGLNKMEKEAIELLPIDAGEIKNE